MNLRSSPFHKRDGGWAVWIVVLTLFVFSIVAASHALFVVHVGQQSSAWDSYRQGSTEGARFERVVDEVMLDQRGIRFIPTGTAIPSLPDDLAATISRLNAGGADLSTLSVPTLESPVMYPSLTSNVTLVGTIPSSIFASFTPDLQMMAGSRAAVSNEMEFRFRSQREVLGHSYNYDYSVKTRLISVPISRFGICAYEYPSEIGQSVTQLPAQSPIPSNPLGLAAGRDPASLSSLDSATTSLPYHFRSRATLASAYQYVFSQKYLNKLSVYAGTTHYYAIDVPADDTANLTGMSRVVGGASLDVGVAGRGRRGLSDEMSSMFVIFTNTAGQTLYLSDSVGSTATAPLFILVCGPANRLLGRLTVNLQGIARPVVIMGANVSITAAANANVNGALLLDPDSQLPSSTGPLYVPHLSYKAGSSLVYASSVVVTGTMPVAAEQLLPRVIYLNSFHSRL